MINWSYNGGNVDNNADDDIGSNGENDSNDENDSIDNIGNIGIFEWLCVFHIPHASLHIKINDTTGVIGAITIINTNSINDADESSFAPMDRQCFQWRH